MGGVPDVGFGRRVGQGVPTSIIALHACIAVVPDNKCSEATSSHALLTSVYFKDLAKGKIHPLPRMTPSEKLCFIPCGPPAHTAAQPRWVGGTGGAPETPSTGGPGGTPRWGFWGEAPKLRNSQWQYVFAVKKSVFMYRVPYQYPVPIYLKRVAPCPSHHLHAKRLARVELCKAARSCTHLGRQRGATCLACQQFPARA